MEGRVLYLPLLSKSLMQKKNPELLQDEEDERVCVCVSCLIRVLPAGCLLNMIVTGARL